MNCGLVFNELSAREADSVDQARQWLLHLLALIRATAKLTGSRQLRTSRKFFDILFGPDYPFARWLHDEKVDIEERRRFKAYVSAARYITSTDPPEILEDWKHAEAWFGDTRARGLFAAFLLDSFALSLPSGSPWEKPAVELKILRLGEDTNEVILAESRVSVHHLSEIEHLEAHREWLESRDGAAAVFRRTVDFAECRHVPASGYGKHVQGATNEERSEKARRFAASQFVATLGVRQITDEVIESWERETLRAAWEGSPSVRIVLHGSEGSSFHLYSRRDHVTGYAGQTGEEIDSLRVEWSSRQVHSHPHKLEE